MIGPITDIVHFGAETHVDRSITDPIPFMESNIIGTANVLDYARRINLSGKFVMFSTDEVFGPAPEGVAYSEYDPTHAQNPYAAAKAGAEQICLSYANTYGLDISIMRSMNIFGEMQDGEKFIPLVIKKILNNEKIMIHADKTKTKAGSRFYTYVEDVCRAVDKVLINGKSGNAYHVTGEKEVDNLSLVQSISKIIGKPCEYELVDFHSSRPGHDLRYALADNYMSTLGWKRTQTFEQSLEKTVNWYLSNKEWL
jgi:dTDP-glucose 4,6-dehydratase